MSPPVPAATGRFLAFGEVMWRLSPPNRELLLQSHRLDAWLAGAEANVAIALAALGHDAGLATLLPDNDLGKAAARELRGAGMAMDAVRIGGERMGLYFVTPGAGLRVTDVIYDRAHSAFAEASADSWDWDVLLRGVDRLHLSGVTPALGPQSAEAALAAATAAAARGVRISFDGNWRGKLWARWDGDARVILTELVGLADLLFGNHRDVALLLGREFSGDGPERRREAAEAAFAHFPNLQVIASTARHVEHADTHTLTARIDTRNDAIETEELRLSGIVDRIGGGDAFAAGVLHAFRLGQDARVAAKSGLTLSALKHSQPGDACRFSREDLDMALAGESLDVRR